MKKILALSAALALSGCATLPTAEEVAAADFGSEPTDHEEIVRTYYGNTLRDPDSAQYRTITNPRQYWLGDRFNGAQYGYLVCVTLNAKNAYGAYVGYKTDGLLIRNGTVVLHVPEGNWFGRQIC